MKHPANEALAALAERFGLADPSAAGRLDALLRVLATDPHAPTTLTDPREAADAHLADSLVALEVPAVRAARAVADVGAGVGLPGLALAVALPEARVWLVESVGRKCEFLERAIPAAGIANAEVVCARAEEWEAGRGACDLVTARALAALPVVVEYAAPLLRVGGSLVAWKGRRDPAEERDGAAAAARLGLELAEARAVHPYPAARHRHLHVFRKVAPTPPEFPRRPGMAAKRPQRAS
ncbi:MAG: 16S rRNA (guanine(527)-N(7))-methyltransferase RsmG [Actinomycetota bacterium]|nr:16S rRNA (guanine(527)-N(7))-methyltransferase RsmG [Actinomycetota bacterium]